MQVDFPAAHSMDTAWYAVDQEGHVAVFVTGSDGHVPRGAATSEDAPPLPPELRDDLFAFEYEEHFEYSFFAQPYTRTDVPARPLHIDQLPPQLREAYGRLRFDALRFAEAEHVQPLEFAACDAWGGEAWPIYLSGDCTTVRPVPGREQEFQALCEEVKGHLPPELKNLRFEGLEEPKPKRRAPRRRKKGADDER
jgi:hypothetical protein